MRKLVYIVASVFILSACGLNKQTRQIDALEKCTYEISSADSVYLAGRDISKLIKDRTIDLSSAPEIAWALLRKNIPFRAKVNLRISNPGDSQAAINQFDYIVLIKDQEIANGSLNQKVVIEPGAETIVPVRVNSNIYSFLSNGKTMEEILAFLRGGESGAAEKKGVVTIKIKPTIEVGGSLIKYPGYITINREVSSKILF